MEENPRRRGGGLMGLQDWGEKFSRHLVIRIPQTAFKDNTHVGAFVSEMCSWICSECGKDSQLDKLYIRKDACSADSSQLFLDTAVYSRNRCFRLVSSSKSGKNSVLFPTRRFRCKNMSDKEIFMDSLICRIETDCKKLLVCKVDVDCKKCFSFDFEVNADHGQGPEALGNTTALHSAENFTSACFTGRSPFPTLDSFIETIASLGNSLGKIRSWYWFSAHGLMIYSMSRSRYCERIGREHKSNHGYRSPFRPLPKDMLPGGMAFSTLRGSDNNGDASNMDFDRDESELGEGSFDYSEWITDSCNRDKRWWLEAIKYADHIENTREILEFCNQDKWEEDCNWWMEVDNVVSDVEEKVGEEVLQASTADDFQTDVGVF
ncbi:hypothetical protein Taro_012972 [Colocasia esculenta]|uniref:DNA-directed primase/polymerase protein n=1 Tax=Colocasia esculenta TaxID=4460 RepID=A0A843UAK7_COLES|nr:hypothetical protein [Colocasia esculenta]